MVGGRWIKDLCSLLTGHGFVRLVSFVATLQVTQALGPTEFGTLSFGLAIAVLFGLCANLGLDDVLVREIARDQDSGAALLGDAILVKALLLPVGGIAAAGLTLARPADGPLYLWLVAFAVLHSYLLLLCAVFRGHRRMELQALLLSMQTVLIAGSTTLGARLTASAAWVATGYVVATAASLVVGYTLLRRQGARPRFGWRPAVWRATLGTALPFAAVLVSLLAGDRLALTTLALAGGQAAAGWFGAAHSIVLGLTGLPSLAVVATFPVLAGIAARRSAGRHELATVAIPLLKLMVVAGLALGGSLSFVAPVLLPRLLGPAYLPAVPLLQILAAGLPFVCLSLALASLLEATDRQRVAALAIGCAVVVGAPIAIAAVHHWGPVGAALAHVATHALTCTFLLRPVAGVIGWRAVGAGAGAPSLIGVGLVLVAALGHRWPPSVLLPVAGASAAVLLVASGTLGRRELTLLRAALPVGRRASGDAPRLAEAASWSNR